VSATLNQSAQLRARLEVIYDVVHETAQRSREICDVAWAGTGQGGTGEGAAHGYPPAVTTNGLA
jgi:hypothetical protein